VFVVSIVDQELRMDSESIDQFFLETYNGYRFYYSRDSHV